MTLELSDFRFVVKALPNKGQRPRELAHTMPAHPLSYMELPFDPEYALYNSRLTPEALNTASEDEMYWAVRTNVIFRHTGELPIEISGPDAEILLNKVFTRNVSKVKPGRCSYQFACYHDGGMITDGVLLRLSEDRFWMAQADGRSCWISRSGFTNELGWEVYLLPDTDIPAIGNHIMEIGKNFDILLTGTPVFRARRIEAGLLNAGSDFGADTTPFDAGLGIFVEFDDRDFVGRKALEAADKSCRTWGMRVTKGVAHLGRVMTAEGKYVGRVCSSGYSPYQGCGVCIVRMDEPAFGPGTVIDVLCVDGSTQRGELCTLPMYDADRLIPRGKLVDIPTSPIAAE